MMTPTMIAFNQALPVIGIVCVLVPLLSKRWDTSHWVVAVILHTQLLIWLFLVWAEFGSEVYVASCQIILVRLMMIFLMFMIFQILPNRSKDDDLLLKK